MLDQEDLKWIATTSTELNSMLQQISRYSDLARRHKGEYNYVDMLGERVELAAKTAQAMFDRVTSAIMTNVTPPAAGKRHSPPAFSVMPAPVSLSSKPAPTETMERPRFSPAPQHLPTIVTDGNPIGVDVLNPNGKRELILFVEDELEVARLAGEMLVEEDYRVILAKDGFEALKIYQLLGEKIGLVILDFFLPIMDGDAVFDELRALNPKLDVVLSSGFAEQAKVGAMLAQGLRGFIPKPYTRDKLLQQVRSIVDSRGPA